MTTVSLRLENGHEIRSVQIDRIKMPRAIYYGARLFLHDPTQGTRCRCPGDHEGHGAFEVYVVATPMRIPL